MADTGSSSSSNVPGSPSGSCPPSPSAQHSSPTSSNRFGLSLAGFIQRRPRGQSTSGRTIRASSPGTDAVSPATELPPSPLGESGQRGYGFPSLRRQLSKRPGSSGQDSATGAASPSASGSGLGLALARPGIRRSASQPRTPVADLAQQSTSRPHTATGASTTPLLPPADSTDAARTAAEAHHLRLVPHLESNRSLHFDPVDRKVSPFAIVSVGRFTDRSATQPSNSTTDPTRIAFKSKVVSRGHADIWADQTGSFFIRDTKSSSGTFLNHIRLSGPGLESKPFALRDGDILQLGVDYQGGTEEIYRCVKMRVELNRDWQRKKSSFNTNALKQLRELGGSSSSQDPTANVATAGRKPSSVTDCCICLYPVTVCQALFIAPCSHVTHFSCIRPLINKTYPGHTCPVCRTYADLEADVTIDEESDVEEELPVPDAPLDADATLGSSGVTAGGDAVSLDVVAVSAVVSALSASRPSSIRSGRSGRAGTSDLQMASAEVAPAQAVAIAPSPSPMNVSTSIPIAMGSSPWSAGIDDSLFNAATPSNTVFLSTLAETAFNPHPRVHLAATLEQPFRRLNVGSSGLGGAASTSTSTDPSFGSEDETDGTEESAGNGKGKGKQNAAALPVRTEGWNGVPKDVPASMVAGDRTVA